MLLFSFHTSHNIADAGLNDGIDYNKICYTLCADMHDSCYNLTLPYFAHVGLRCNFNGIYDPATGAADPRLVIDANSLCTGLYQGPSCFSADAPVTLAAPNATAG